MTHDDHDTCQSNTCRHHQFSVKVKALQDETLYALYKSKMASDSSVATEELDRVSGRIPVGVAGGLLNIDSVVGRIPDGVTGDAEINTQSGLSDLDSDLEDSSSQSSMSEMEGIRSQNSSMYVGGSSDEDDDDDDEGSLQMMENVNDENTALLDWAPIPDNEFQAAISTQNVDFVEAPNDNEDEGADLSDVCSPFEFGDRITESRNEYVEALAAGSGLRILKPRRVVKAISGKYVDRPELGLFKLFFSGSLMCNICIT